MTPMAVSLNGGMGLTEFCRRSLPRDLPGHLLDELVEQFVAQSLLPQPPPQWPLADMWRLGPGDASRSAIMLVKKLFNYYFRHDLYGPHRVKDFHVLSSGSLHEPTFGLTPALKRCLQIALDNNWYGYSDSRGRFNAREAVAVLENLRLGVDTYTEDSVAVTLGGTFGMSCIVDFLATSLPPGHAVCAVPNYPPLLETIARKMPVQLVHTPAGAETTSIAEVTAAITDTTRIVMLQSVTNPTGLPISETELATLINALGPQTYLILDEAHECLGAARYLSTLRASAQVIRVASMSKQLAIPGMKVGWFLAAEELISDYYEYASTIYGGPASFFYTLVDVYATFQGLQLASDDNRQRQTLHDLASRYNITPAGARSWYQQYCHEQQLLHQAFLQQRDSTVDRLRNAGIQLIEPQYSVNCTISGLPGHNSYGTFRSLLDSGGVSVYPNALAFDVSDSSVRITLGRDPDELHAAIGRLITSMRGHHAY